MQAIARASVDTFSNLLRGVAIGLANVIPGVSGGTMALMLGIYGRLIGAVHSIGPRTFTAVFRGRKAIVAELRRIDALFLATIAVGALGAIVAAADLLRYLLLQQHDPTFGLFFGLVLVSLVVPLRLVRRMSLAAVVSALVAVAVVVGLTLAMSGERQLESAVRKAELKATSPAAAGTTDRVARVPQDTRTMVLFLVAGAVAIAAMILPGISGSFVLLLIGVYFDVLTCISGRQFVLLGVLGLGCVVGLFTFTRLIHYLLDRHHDLTMAFLAGLVAGSLYAIWPFKTFQMVGERRVDLHNVLPQAWGPNETWTLLATLGGCMIVAVFLWIEARAGRPDVQRLP